MALQTGNISIHMYVFVSMHEITSMGFSNALRINATYNIIFDRKERVRYIKSTQY